MIRIILGVIVGFVVWNILWVGSEMILSAIIFPEGYGVHQRAFQDAVKNGGAFTVDTTLLLVHIVQGVIVSVIAGFLAALIAGENKRSPLVVGLLLVAFGLLIVVLSWAYVPFWYHIVFTSLLLPLTFIGGKLRQTKQ